MIPAKSDIWEMMVKSEIYLPLLEKALRHYIDLTLELRGIDNTRSKTRYTVLVEDMLEALENYRREHR